MFWPWRTSKVSPKSEIRPKRIVMEAADHCTKVGDDLGYEILMNVWSYLHYGEERYGDYRFAGTTEDFWREESEVEYGTELCSN